jgi:class 3 adenylate cyclase/CHASE2 domain-containing sensor protein
MQFYGSSLFNDLSGRLALRQKPAILLPVLVVLCLLAVSGTGLLTQMERFLVDKRFQLRQAWGYSPSISSDIAVVWIQEESYQNIQKHWVFWLDLYGEVMTASLESGATVVGLDLIPGYLEAEQLKAFLPLRAHRGKVVLGAYLDRESGLKAPPDLLVALLGAENLALLNLTRDSDGILRSQTLSPIRHEALGLDAFPLLSVKLLEVHSGRPATDMAPNSPLQINYATPSFPSKSFDEVLRLWRAGDTEQLKAFFQGKAVVIASSALKDQDLVETPFSQDSSQGQVRSTFGGEAHLQILNTLLSRQYVHSPSLALQASGWLLLALLLGQVFFRVPPWVGTGFVALGGCLIWLGGCFLFFQHSTLLSLAPPLVGLPTLAGVVYAYRQQTTERERKRLQNAFGRYVSKDVMEEMLRFPQDYDPGLAELREVTVFFSDINGFSTVCEGKTAGQVTKMLNEHFVEMTNIIFRHGGTLIRFNGDEFMVLFGAPKKHPEPETAAVKAALDMIARLQEMEQNDPTGKDGFYQVKIGIHTGPMILTSIGTAQRSDYNAIGDSANLASRVMSLAKQEGVPLLVSEAIWQKAKADATLGADLQGEFEVKGREGKVRVFRPHYK